MSTTSRIGTPLTTGADARFVEQFERPAGLIYLDTVQNGLLPKSAADAMNESVAANRSGAGQWADWDREGEVCRARAADLLLASDDEIALVPAVSVASGLVASGVPLGGEVLVPAGEFVSVLFPFLAAERAGRLTIREVPFDALGESLGPKTTLVALSHVRIEGHGMPDSPSVPTRADLADLRTLAEAAHAVGADLYVDATHSLGVVPFDVEALGIDYLSTSALKWLCCPSGVAFLYVRRSRLEKLVPFTAGWHSLADPWSSDRYFGGPLTLAAGASRFDVSPAWHAWVGGRHALDVVCSLTPEVRYELSLAPARHLAMLFSLPEPQTTLVWVPVRDGRASDEALAALAQAGIRVTARSRSGQILVSPHFYNTISEVERAADVMAPYVTDG